MPPVTRLPYIAPAEHSADRFDQFQFKRPVRAISIETGLDWSDYGGSMHIIHRSQRNGWQPPFALNDSQLRRVIAVQCWRYVRGGRQPMPEEFVSDRRALQWLVEKKFRTRAVKGPYALGTQAWENHQRHIDDVSRAGGYLQFISAIAYRHFRLCETSADIAYAMGIMPTTVRTHVFRLREIARQLGYEVGRTQHGYIGGIRAYERRRRLKPPTRIRMERTATGIKRTALWGRYDVQGAIARHGEGLTWTAIAAEQGVPAVTLYSAVRRATRAA